MTNKCPVTPYWRETGKRNYLATTMAPSPPSDVKKLNRKLRSCNCYTETTHVRRLRIKSVKRIKSTFVLLGHVSNLATRTCFANYVSYLCWIARFKRFFFHMILYDQTFCLTFILIFYHRHMILFANASQNSSYLC